MARAEPDFATLVDERAEHWKSVADKHFYGITDLALMILKGHLVIEQQLTSILAHHVQQPTALADARLSFSQKLAVVRAMCPRYTIDVWEFPRLLNTLRNDYAHELEPPKLEHHLTQLRDLADRYRSKGGQLEGVEVDRTDEGNLRMLTSYHLGALGIIDSTAASLPKSLDLRSGIVSPD